MKNFLFTTCFILVYTLSYAQDGPLYAVQFKTDGGVLLSTQNISAPKDSKASNIEFFTESEENPTAYFPFGSIKELGNEFDMLKLFSDNIPFSYDVSSTKYYLSFMKEKTAGNNFVIQLANVPVVESIDKSSSMYFLPTKFESKVDVEKLVKKLKANFDQNYYDKFVSFGVK
ncbi:hypothetical protein GCM10011506_41480 [Marivirga lumbricoides]|uniref:Uncharacterized protein n=1 Tax=Marivirga lumbricoides TaxID=1046115 RepID=A0ABQ1N933_9BACT|nr:hypothetical protein GCM10011506_41480 [Marivirga lumbricoides]